MSERIIQVAEFEERLAAICLGGAGSAFPRRLRDRHILYRTIIQPMDPSKKYTEEQVNDVLRQWRLDIGACLDIDHVTLRRYLIDELYLTREASGTAYVVNSAGRGFVEFEESVVAIDPVTVIQSARDRASERKRMHSQ